MDLFNMEGVRLAISVALTSLCLAGCSDEAPAGSNGELSTGSADAAAAQSIAVKADLATSPINLDDAFGRTPPTIVEPNPCPFLSDVTAIATARAGESRPLARRSTSNELCRWSYNAGFSVAIRIGPVDESVPVDERRYNMGSDPVIDRQDGPGSNAVLLKDPTWDEKNPRPYAYGFELDGKSISIQVVGMATSLAQLRATADEIAAKLPAAPAVEPSRFQSIAAFDHCTVWETDSLKSLFTYAADDEAWGRSYGSGCTYELKAKYGKPKRDMRASVGFTRFENPVMEKLIAKGAKRIDGYDLPVIRRTITNEHERAVTLSAFMGNDEISVSLAAAEEPDVDDARRLFDNVLARIEQ